MECRKLFGLAFFIIFHNRLNPNQKMETLKCNLNAITASYCFLEAALGRCKTHIGQKKYEKVAVTSSRSVGFQSFSSITCRQDFLGAEKFGPGLFQPCKCEKLKSKQI